MGLKKYEPTGHVKDGYYRLKKELKFDNGDVWEKGTVVYAGNEEGRYRIQDNQCNKMYIKPVNDREDYDDRLTSILEKTSDIKDMESDLELIKSTDYGKQGEEAYTKAHPILGRLAEWCYDSDGNYKNENPALFTVAMSFIFAVISFIIYYVVSNETNDRKWMMLPMILMLWVLRGLLMYLVVDAFFDSITHKYIAGYRKKRALIAEQKARIWQLDKKPKTQPMKETPQLTEKKPSFGDVITEHYELDLELTRTVPGSSSMVSSI